MAGYGALKRQMGQNLSKRLRKIVLHMPSAETGGKHVTRITGRREDAGLVSV